MSVQLSRVTTVSLGTLSFRETLYRRGLKVGVSSFTSRTDTGTDTERQTEKRREDTHIDVREDKYGLRAAQ